MLFMVAGFCACRYFHPPAITLFALPEIHLIFIFFEVDGVFSIISVIFARIIIFAAVETINKIPDDAGSKLRSLVAPV